MKSLQYHCELCEDGPFDGHWVRGFVEDEMVIGVQVCDPEHADRHICKDCIRAIRKDARRKKG